MSLNYANLNALGKSIDGLSPEELKNLVDEQGSAAVIAGATAAAVASFTPSEPLSSPASIMWRLDTDEGQKPVRLLLDTEGCHVDADPGDQESDATLTTNLPTFLRLISGKLSGMQAYAQEDLALDGDMLLSLRQMTYFGLDPNEAELDLSTTHELARLVKGRSDDEITTAVELSGLDRVLTLVFRGMEEQFQPEKASGKRGTIEWNIRTRQGMRTHHITIEGGRCKAHEGAAGSPTVRLTASLTVFLRTIAGQLNGLQAYADGALQVTGDLVLAQLQQTFFNADLSDAVLDISTPNQLKKLIDGRTDAELEAGVIVTGVDKALDMVFDGMVEYFLPHKAGKKKAVIQWDISTPDGLRIYQFRVDRGQREYSRGAASQKPDCRLAVNLPNFLRIASGQLNGIIALAKGQLKVKTGLLLARTQQSWFDFNR